LREIRRRYRDPLDEVWLGLARRVGFRVARTAAVFASTDGDRVIQVGTPEVLDADDSLAQMILHELCHALVEGEDAWSRPDWGLDNQGLDSQGLDSQTRRDELREQACLRLQAALLAPHGLREVLAPTTEHRGFYDALGADALAPAGDAAVVLAKIALERAGRAPFAPHLEAALAATATIARAAAPFAAEDSLAAAVAAPAPRHPLGFPMRAAGAGGAETCAGCAWLAGRTCRQADARADPAWPACDRWEPAGALECQACAACCREAYHSVTIGPRDPVRRRHPELVAARDGYYELMRAGGRCAALVGGDAGGPSYACRIYADRPRTCRDFTVGGSHCLQARRRVGLSR
jgi:putative zinc- or iron-chelating protein